MEVIEFFSSGGKTLVTVHGEAVFIWNRGKPNRLHHRLKHVSIEDAARQTNNRLITITAG